MNEAYRGSPIAARHAVITQRLRERRDDLGLTQKQIVTRLARCGLQTTNRALSSLEHGSGLDVAKLPELAIALDCTVTYLIGLTEDPHSWEPDVPTVLPMRASALRAAPPRTGPGAPRARPEPTVVAEPGPRPEPDPEAAGSLILGGYLPDSPPSRRRTGR